MMDTENNNKASNLGERGLEQDRNKTIPNLSQSEGGTISC